MTSPTETDEDDEDPWLDGPAYSSQEDEDDDDFFEVVPGRVDVEGPGIVWKKLLELELRVEVTKVTAKGAVAEGHLHEKFDTADDENVVDIEWVYATIGPKPPMVATVTSPCFHGNPLFPGLGSTNVYAENKPVWRMLIDQHVCLAATPNPHGSGVVLPMGPLSGVFVNGYPVARAGDSVMELMGGGPNPIMYGAGSVWAGSPAPPVRTINPNPRITVEEDPWYTKARKWVFDVDLEGEAGVDVELAPQTDSVTGGGVVDPLDKAWGINMRVDSEGELIHAKGHAAGKWKGWGEVYFDPATKKGGVRGDIDFGDPEED